MSAYKLSCKAAVKLIALLRFLSSSDAHLAKMHLVKYHLVWMTYTPEPGYKRKYSDDQQRNFVVPLGTYAGAPLCPFHETT